MSLSNYLASTVFALVGISIFAPYSQAQDSQRVEQVFPLKQGDEKAVEKVISDENVQLLHMIFPKGDGTPMHVTNAPLYMTVIRGTLSFALENQPVHQYVKGTVLSIPKGVKMKASNAEEPILELLVVKAPSPDKPSK